MARPLRPHLPGVLCHVLSRGNNKQRIFIDETDYRHYIELLAAGLGRFQVSCAAFCLLVTHIHLLVRPGQFPISRMMQQVNSAYCRWWNRRYDRVGHVLQGRFKLLLVSDEIYRRRVIRYVLRNPLAADVVGRLEDWRWSSYRASAGFDPVPPFLNADEVWSLFPVTGRLTPTQQLREFMASSADDVLEMRGLLAATPAYSAIIESEFRSYQDNPEFVYAHKFAARPSLEDLFENSGVPMEFGAARAFEEYGYSLGDLARYLGRRPSTIWTWIRRGVRSRSSMRLRKIEI